MFFRSLKNALRGIYYCIKNERNFRVHTVAALYVLVFSRFFDLTKNQYCILFLTIALVMTMESLNTAIEKILDYTHESYSTVIKVVKDLSAGAVLLSAIGAIFVGTYLFNDVEKWFFIFNYFSKNILFQVLFIISIFISLAYINGSKGKIFIKNFKFFNKKERND